MEPRTNTANTQDWLEASKGIKIAAYIQHYVGTLSLHARQLPSQDFDALKKISVPLPRQRTWDDVMEDVLHDRAEAWERLANL
jgi:hypothetical protein